MAIYQTTLRTVNGISAVGANGERLIFIGNFPCRAGDIVWTDGNVIFGHTAPKASAIILPRDVGLPLVYFDSNYAFGYINNGGSIRKLPIGTQLSKNDWIVNGEKAFYHLGSAEFMLDAEISTNNDEEVGMYTAQVKSEVGDSLTCLGTYYLVEDGEVKIDNYISIEKDGTETERIYLRDYAEAIQKVDAIYDEELGVAKKNASEPIDGRVQLLAFKLDTKGGWEAIVASFAYGELKYYEIDNRGRWRDKYLHGVNTQITADLVPLSSIENDDETLYEKIEGFLEPGITEITRITRTTTGIDYFEPPDKIRRCSAYYLVHVKSNGEKEILHEDVALQPSEKDLIAQLAVNGAGTTFATFDVGTITTFQYRNSWGIMVDMEDIDNRHPITVNCIKHKNKEGYHIENYKSDWTFPMQDDSFLLMNEWQIYAFFANDKGLYPARYVDTSSVFKGRFLMIAEDDVSKNVDDVYMVRCVDGYGYYDFPNKKVLMAYVSNISTATEKIIQYPQIVAMTKEKNNYYLIVPKSNTGKCALYKLNDNRIELMSSDVQNFRLRKMKNLAKAKNNWSK